MCRPVGSLGLVAAIVSAVPSPARAQAPAAPPAGAPADAAATNEGGEPTVDERMIVAIVASGVAVASLATGVTFGVLAQVEFDCAKDVVACNKNLDNKIVGEELIDVRSEIEQKAVFADMSYTLAAAAAVVATVQFLNIFVFSEPAAQAPVAALAPSSLPSAVAVGPAAVPAPPASPGAAASSSAEGR